MNSTSIKRQNPLPLEEDITYSIGKFLDGSGEKYLDAINDVRPESFVNMIDRLYPLTYYIKTPRILISVGIGQGEEIQALRHIFPDRKVKIVGIDISEVALAKTQQRLSYNKLSIPLMKANATRLPFKRGAVDGIFMSSILHEVFSYHPKGYDAWEESLQEAARVLSPGGILFVRDFAAPDEKGLVRCIFKTKIARDFYIFFSQRFGKFTSDVWSDKSKNREGVNIFPVLEKNGNSITLPYPNIGELLLHFRNFWCDLQSGSVKFNDKNWKEANEMYYLTHEGISPDVYTQKVIEAMNKGILKTEAIYLLSRKFIQKETTNKFIAHHFALKLENSLNHYSGEELIAQITRKLELIFSKNFI